MQIRLGVRSLKDDLEEGLVVAVVGREILEFVEHDKFGGGRSCRRRVRARGVGGFLAFLSASAARVVDRTRRAQTASTVASIVLPVLGSVMRMAGSRPSTQVSSASAGSVPCFPSTLSPPSTRLLFVAGQRGDHVMVVTLIGLAAGGYGPFA